MRVIPWNPSNRTSKDPGTCALPETGGPELGQASEAAVTLDAPAAADGRGTCALPAVGGLEIGVASEAVVVLDVAAAAGVEVVPYYRIPQHTGRGTGWAAGYSTMLTTTQLSKRIISCYDVFTHPNPLAHLGIAVV